MTGCAVFDELLARLAGETRVDEPGLGIPCVRGPLHRKWRREADELRWTDPKSHVVHVYVKTTLRGNGAEVTFFAYDGLELMQRPTEKAV